MSDKPSKQLADMGRSVGYMINPLKNPLAESILLSVQWLAILVLSTLMSSSINVETGEISTRTVVYYGVIFFLNSAAYLYDIIRFRKKSLELVRAIVSVLVPLILGFISIFLGLNPLVFMIISVVFYSLMIFRHIMSVIMHKDLRKGILDGVLIILWITCIVFCVHAWTAHGIVAMTVAVSHLIIALVMTVTSAFRRLQFSILIRIIKRTFAVEVFVGLISLVVAFSIAFFYLEKSQFENIGDALWYSFAIITTIGFGDFTTKTFVTRILSVILGMYGIISVAVITSIIVNFYSETKAIADDIERKKKEKEGGDSQSKENMPPSVEELRAMVAEELEKRDQEERRHKK